MKNTINLTQGSIFKNLIRFSLPFLLSSFLQTFYGLADLFFTGKYYGADSITAVSVGSQVMHMVTVVIVSLTMGITVAVGRRVGASADKEDEAGIKKILGNAYTVFFIFTLILVTLMMINADAILGLLKAPAEAYDETKRYIIICVAGTFFISAFNVISSTLRGIGDSKSPMYFVAIAGIINIALDWLLIGGFSLGAMGAALATASSQGVCAVSAYIYSLKRNALFRIKLTDLIPDKSIVLQLVRIGVPVAAQDGFIQIAFLVITAIANARGVDVAAAVGIVEKLISFMFLVPSAMLAAVSAITAQNVGAGLYRRGRRTLLYGILCCVVSGLIFTLICEIWAEPIVGLFSENNAQVIAYGAEYLRTYVFDCVVAGIHFCFSGYFCAYEKSYLSFIQNVISALAVRIPGAYIASALYPDTLLPMGLAAPLGSLLSSIICVIAYVLIKEFHVTEEH